VAVYYRFQGINLIKLESAVITDKSDVYANFRQKSENERFFIAFCSKHFTVQIIPSMKKPKPGLISKTF
jgi:ribosomal protein L18